MNEDGMKVWLFGCFIDLGVIDFGVNGLEEYFLDIMEIDLWCYGFLGNNMVLEFCIICLFFCIWYVEIFFKGFGDDLVKFFNQFLELGSGMDFIVIVFLRDFDEEEVMGLVFVYV